MKKIRIVLIMSMLVAILPTMEAQPQVGDKHYAAKLSSLLAHSVPEIAVSKAATLNDVVFLDAREKTEFNVSHLPDARWIGYDDFHAGRLSGVSKQQKIVIYCSVGYRSEKISEKLRKLGYTDVSNLYGGIFEWVNQGNEVVDTLNQSTLQVHTYNKEWSQWLRKGKKIY